MEWTQFEWETSDQAREVKDAPMSSRADTVHCGITVMMVGVVNVIASSSWCRCHNDTVGWETNGRA